MSVLASQTAYAALASFCAGLGCVSDLRTRRIPNKLTGPVFLCGLLLHGCKDGWTGVVSAAMGGILVGGFFLLFFLAGGMGAGDVKLIAGTAAIAGLPSSATLMFAIVVAGTIAAVLLAVSKGRLLATIRNVGDVIRHHQLHGLAPHPMVNMQNQAALRLPYALPIAAACTCVTLVDLWTSRG